jgi:hypothetical protein
MCPVEGEIAKVDDNVRSGAATKRTAASQLASASGAAGDKWVSDTMIRRTERFTSEPYRPYDG